MRAVKLDISWNSVYSIQKLWGPSEERQWRIGACEWRAQDC